MSKNKIVVISLLITIGCCFSTTLTADDAARFQPQNYKGRQLDNRSYSAKSYSSKKSSEARQYTAPQNKSNAFRRFLGLDSKSKDKTLQEVKSVESSGYETESQHKLAVKEAESKVLKNQKSVDPAAAEKGEPFKPAEKRAGRDPMLQPRQGIKLPVQQNNN